MRNPSAVGSSAANESASVCSCVASPRPGVNGTSTVDAAVGGGLLDRGGAAEHDQVGERDRLAEAGLDALERAEHLRELRPGR